MIKTFWYEQFELDDWIWEMCSVFGGLFDQSPTVYGPLREIEVSFYIKTQLAMSEWLSKFSWQDFFPSSL